MSYLASSDGTILYYKDWGAGRPVVFIHGWPVNSDMWDSQMLHFANNGFRAVAYDRRGFGRSDQPWNGYNYKTLADDLNAVMTRLSLEDALLVGFSMGCGEVVRYLAWCGSSRVSGAVLIGPVTPGLMRTESRPEGVDPGTFEGMREAIRRDRASFLAGFNPLMTGSNRADSAVTAEVLNWLQAMELQGSIKATVECVTAFSATDFEEDLAKITVPTLIIHGGDDRTAPLELTSRITAKLIKGSKLAVYEGAPHALMLTHGERLNRDLLEFAQASHGNKAR
ncbi:alpha/beta hydrolase [Paraburkholderia sp. MMS20-SJTN17]|uniref:Alpha/beta hydrolase n=1 Tax=Paraburkholderia translucens TaxID=2886945 RepID=A0ABS8KCM8_9BURK|nr:alpha/beta hydrolase [Paraburkholderia sp. MMS20-SJTN17]MCC8402460.1 alpha/beta hydrolase [Paraburkholderia sp. MMS20-SJTN17]